MLRGKKQGRTEALKAQLRTLKQGQLAFETAVGEWTEEAKEAWSRLDFAKRKMHDSVVRAEAETETQRQGSPKEFGNDLSLPQMTPWSCRVYTDPVPWEQEKK